jgi:cyclopropane fatty-acyl-phospholipid synthase-like methyltransferase
MNRASADFGPLARWYSILEFVAFGRDLERARFEFLSRLSGSRDVLLLGEGDGRCAERLAKLAPGARILCVDSSQRMIERASRRVVGDISSGRVTFKCADVLSFTPEFGRFDAVVTLFFLDCFEDAGVASIVARMDAALRPGALWLFADFALPKRGMPLLRARIWLKVLYAFFRLSTGLRVSKLPPSENILTRAGWRQIECRDFQWGMIRSAVYCRHPEMVKARRSHENGQRSPSRRERFG